MRTSVFMLLFAAAIACAQAPGKPMPAKELSEFLGPAPPKAITWTKVRGPDFDVYHGHPNSPLEGDIGFYLGGWPSFEADPASKVVEGKLGIFPVQWHRITASDGSVRQEAVIPLDDYWKVDIWVSAKQQSDVDRILEVVAQLPTFTKKPKPINTQ
jgi:hypothetical protein